MRLVLSLVALLALAGCPLANECTSDDGCGGELVCELSPADRARGLCLEASPCERDFDCAAHDGVRYVCSDEGICRLPCDDDDECGSGWQCATAPSTLRACVPPAAP